MDTPVLFCILKKVREESRGNWCVFTGKYLDADEESIYYVAWHGNFVAASRDNREDLLKHLTINYGYFKFVEIDTQGWRM